MSLLHIADREPLDKVIAGLDSGYTLIEDAPRRRRILRDARAEHDPGDEDDGAIERGLAECARQLCERQRRKELYGPLGLRPMGAARYVATIGYGSVAEHALEAAKREPLNLYTQRLAEAHDAIKKHDHIAAAIAYGLFSVDKTADSDEDTDMKVTAEEIEALRFLRRHFPLWFREDSDGCGTHEQRARDVLDRLIARGPK